MSCLEAPLHQPPAPFSKAGAPLSKCPPRTLGRVEKSRRLAVYTRPGCLLRAGGSGLGPQELDSPSREVGGCCGSTGWPASALPQTSHQGVGGDLRNAH